MPDKKKYEFMGVSQMKGHTSVAHGDTRNNQGFASQQNKQGVLSDYNSSQYKSKVHKLDSSGREFNSNRQSRDQESSKSPNKILTPSSHTQNLKNQMEVREAHSRMNNNY